MLNQLAQTYTYNYSLNSTSSTSHLSGGLIFAIVLASLVLAVIAITAMWKIFVKAGRPGWASVIPVYNSWVLFEISGKPGWWALSILLGFIPFVGSLVFLVLYIIAMLELAKRFGKSTAFAVFGLIIFSFVGLLILGFGDAKYSGNSSVDAGMAPKPTPPTPTPVNPQAPQAPTAQ